MESEDESGSSVNLEREERKPSRLVIKSERVGEIILYLNFTFESHGLTKMSILTFNKEEIKLAFYT